MQIDKRVRIMELRTAISISKAIAFHRTRSLRFSLRSVRNSKPSTPPSQPSLKAVTWTYAAPEQTFSKTLRRSLGKLNL